MIWWLTQHTLTVAALVAVVWLVCRRRRISPAVEHALWLVVLVKLMAPPLVTWPWPAPAWIEGEQSAANEPLPLASVVSRFVPSEALIPLKDDTVNLPEPMTNFELAGNGEMSAESDGSVDVSANEGMKATDFPVLREGSSGPAQSSVGEADVTPATAWGFTVFRLPRWLGPVLLAIWLSGSTVVACRQCRGIRRARRLRAHAQEAPPRLVAEVARLAALLRIGPPRVYVLPGIASPFVWCLGRPTLWWPAALLNDGATGRWRGVVLHELAHLRRRDHWVAWIDLATGCVWWFNPLAWYVRRRRHKSAELACDAWVVATLPDERRTYAEALFEVARVESQIAAPLPAVGISAGTHRDFQRRLTMILRDRVRCRVSLGALFLTGLLSLAALPGWSQDAGRSEGDSADDARDEAGSSKSRDYQGVCQGQVVKDQGKSNATPDGEGATDDRGDHIQNFSFFMPPANAKGENTVDEAKTDTPVVKKKTVAPLARPRPGEPRLSNDVRFQETISKKVLSFAASPDGTVVALGRDPADGDGAVWIWVTQTGQVGGRGYLSSAVTAVAYGPDARSLVCGCADGTVAVWHPTTANEKMIALSYWSVAGAGGKPITAVAFTPDGKTVAAIGSDQAVHLWDEVTEKERLVVGLGDNTRTFAFSPDGTTLATGGGDERSGTLKLWDLEGKLMGAFAGHSAVVTSLAFLPDGHSLVSGSLDQTIIHWDVATRRLLEKLHSITPMAFVSVSKDGSVLAVCDTRGNVTFWDQFGASGGAQFRPGMELWVDASVPPAGVFVGDGKFLVLGGDDGCTPRFLPVASAPGTPEYDQLSKELWAIRAWRMMAASHPNPIAGSNAYGPQDRSGYARPPASGDGYGTNEPHAMPSAPKKPPAATMRAPTKVLCLTVTPDGQGVTLGGASDDGKGLFNIWVEKPNAVLGGAYRPSPVTAIAYSHNGKDLACGQADGNVAVWHHSPTKGNVLLNWNLGTARGQNDGNGTTALAFTPDGKFLAALGPDRAVHLWDPESEKEVQVCGAGQDGPVRCFTFSPDGKTISAGVGDERFGTVIAWDRSGRVFAAIDSRTKPVTAIAFSTDGELIITGGRDRKLCIVSFPEGKRQTTLELDSPVVSIAVNRRGNVLAAGGNDGSVTVWRIGPPGATARLMKLEAKDVAAPLASFDSRGRLVVISNDEKHTPRLIDEFGEPEEKTPLVFAIPVTSTRGGDPVNKTKGPTPAADDVQTLSRAKYSLPAAKAAALEAFLRDNVSAEVETKIDGETIMITTDPETQEIIGRFIALMQKELG